jgi:hypothetical protein
MQLDVAFDWFERQKGHLAPGFDNPGRANVVSQNPARLIFGQSPAWFTVDRTPERLMAKVTSKKKRYPLAKIFRLNGIYIVAQK